MTAMNTHTKPIHRSPTTVGARTVLSVLLIVLTVSCLMRNGVWHDPLLLWEDVVAKSPDKARGHIFLGIADFDEFFTDAALEQYKIAIRIEPNYAEAYFNLGKAYDAQGRADMAIEFYETSVRLSDKDHDVPVSVLERNRASSGYAPFAVAYDNLGNLYLQQGRTREALDRFDRAILSSPLNPQYLIDRGLAYLQARELDRAIEDNTRAIALDPAATVPYVNRGNAFDQKGMPDRALEDYARAIKIEPNDANIYYNRGITYYNMHKRDAALADLQKACVLGSEKGCIALGKVKARK